MTGIQDIPLRIPTEWDPKWFETLIRDVLANADIRNATGVGVEISGNSAETATLTGAGTTDSYIVVGPNPNLSTERVLAVEASVLLLTDNGPDTTIVISIPANGLPFAKLQQIATARIAGRVTASTGDIEELTAAQARTVLVLATTDAVTFLTANVGTGGYLVSSTKVVGAQEAAIASLTNSTGGSADGTMSAVGDTSTSNEGAVINDNFTELFTKQDAILAALRSHGLIDT